MSTFNQIFKNNQYDLKKVVGKSKSWFDGEIRSLAKQRVSQYYLMRANTERNVQIIQPGELYMFGYDAKLKDTLPYWDAFPLVFPFRKLPDGFIGLNMHYLPYQGRIRLLDKLMEYKSNNAMDETTRLKLSWSVISSFSQLKAAQPCVHRYLNNHVKTVFKKVNGNEWATAMMLPVEKFVGASKQQVWTDSRR